jgi:hypothetical protein
VEQVNVSIHEVPVTCSPHPRLILLTLLLAPLPSAAAQTSTRPSAPALEILPTAAYLAFDTYFTGPGDIRFSNQDGIGYGAQVAVALWRNLSLVGSVLHGTSDWSFESVPIVGSVSIGGASLWFYDVGLRLDFPLGGASPLSAIGQVGAGAIRYSVDNALISDQATNFALSGGVGVAARLGRRVSLQGLVKDYIASFRSVDDAAGFGVEGRRAHTLGFLIGFGLRL